MEEITPLPSINVNLIVYTQHRYYMYILNTHPIDALSLNFGDLGLNFLSTSQERKKKKSLVSYVCLKT